MPPRYDAAACHDEGPHGHFSGIKCLLSLGQREFHEMFVVHDHPTK
jgi:hypothetical protein